MKLLCWLGWHAKPWRAWHVKSPHCRRCGKYIAAWYDEFQDPALREGKK